MFGSDIPKFSFTAPPNGGLFGAKPADGEQPKPLFGGLNTIKPTEEKSATSKNLFGSGSTLWKPAVGGEFGGKKLEQPAAKALFSFKTQDEIAAESEKLFKPAEGGLFGGKPVPAPAKPAGGLFSGAPAGSLFGSQPSTGLFGAPAVKPTGSLFGAPVATGSLFGATASTSVF